MKEISSSKELEKVLGGNETVKVSQERHCSLGIDHFYKNYVISPMGFKNAEHCSKFSVRELSVFESAMKGMSRTGCDYCKYYV